VWVSLSKRNKEIAVMVRDDGVGVPEQTAQFREGKTGVGIASMRQRAKELGGEMSIRNANPGTIVELVVPNWSSQSSAGPAARKQSVVQWS
jgi:signal transduction histidine kinase